VIEGSQTVALLVAGEHLARSSGGATIDMDDQALVPPSRRHVMAPADLTARARWAGSSDRARLLEGLETRPRVVGARR
jgi:hypothetical protein